MKNMDNPRGFLNWQGNKLSYTYLGNYIVLGIILLSLILGIIFKNHIRHYFMVRANHKILFFKNINVLLQVIGITMILIWTFRIIILIVYQYPLYYEHIGLHLCRLHFILISLFLTFQKKELIKYILYISFLGSIIGIGFGTTKINDINKPGNIFLDKGFTFYNAGPDTHYYWDYHITHLITGVMPIIISIGINKKMSTVNFYRTIIIYCSTLTLLFGMNWASDYLENRSWRSNYWYVGRDRNNKFHEFLGPLTKWPQNLFSYMVSGILVSYTGNLISFAVQSNFKANCKAFIKDHNRETWRQIFTNN